ncbi:MAG: type IV pilus twitching motility protein PilT [bacterium]|nr:type IV pilus twitching motility protein PilT [bacterium]
MNKILSEKEFVLIDAEYANVFKNRETFDYNGKTIHTKQGQNRREFIIPGDTRGIASEPSPPTASPPPVEPSPPAATPPAPAGNFDLDAILRLMVEKGASDLHLATDCKPLMRIDGDMAVQEEFPQLTKEDLYSEFERIAPERNIEQFAEINDSDFAYPLEGIARFRVNVFRDLKGIGMVLRVIPTKILTVDQLQVPSAMVELCKIPKGLILVTGPTGSGKSTTLAALIDNINKTQRKHIITVEDPVEFVHPNKLSLVNQREISTHTKSFKNALRAALREDPDIILVGEMRDLETIAIAIEMAVTGHLVFGTLHTSTAIGTIDRIIDQFPADQQAQIKTMLADALIGVIAQTLLKRKEGGRVGAYEVLVVTPAASNLIREGKNFQIATIMQTGKALGMQLINNHLTELVEKGIADAEEAISKAVDKDSLKTSLKGKGLYNEVS